MEQTDGRADAPIPPSGAARSVTAPPSRADLSLRERALRFAFRRCMKDKHLKRLVRRFWPPMRATVDGHAFELHPADNTTEFRLFVDGRLDEPVSLGALAGRIAGRRVRVLDIGANCGAWTVPLARAAGAGSEVLAFEPNPVMAARLRTNLSLNEPQARVRVHEVALGATAGTATLHLHAKNLGQSSLRALDASTRTVEVARVPLADFHTGADARDWELTVVKIDVEGREDDVLCPWLDNLADAALPGAIVVETVLAREWSRDLVAQLHERGYRNVLEAEGNVVFERPDARGGLDGPAGRGDPEGPDA